MEKIPQSAPSPDFIWKVGLLALILICAILIYTFGEVFGGALVKRNNIENSSLENGLVGYWTFDESEMELNVGDLSAEGNHGTLGGFVSTTTIPGELGQALSFDGTDDYVSIPDDASLDFGSGENIAVAAWVKPNSFSGFEFSEFVIKGRATESTTGNYSLRQTDTGAVQFYYRDNDSLVWQIWTSTSKHLALNRWTHVLVTYTFATGSSIKMYVNGEEVSGSWTSGSGNVAPIQNNEPLIFGSKQFDAGGGDPDTYYHGALDDVRIYSRVLSANEAVTLYELGTETHINTTITTNSDLENGLLAHYTFDGGRLDMDLASAEVRDSSVNGNHANWLNHATTTRPGKIGQAIDFDGTDDYIDGGTGSSLEPAPPLSVAFWFKLDSHVAVGASPLVYHRSATTNNYDGYWIAVTTAGALNINYGSDGGICTSAARRTKETAASTIATGNWYHVVGVMRGATDMDIYINGVNAGGNYSGTGGTFAYDTTSFLSLGRGGQGSTCALLYTNGAMDDVRIYNRALSGNEAERLYHLGATSHLNTTISTSDSLENGLVGHWTFDGQNIDTSSGLAEIRDRSSNANHGNWLNHATTTRPGKIGQAVDFDGSDDYISVDDPVNASLDFGATNDFSLAAWVNVHPTLTGAREHIISKRGNLGNGSGPGYRLYLDASDRSLNVLIDDGLSNFVAYDTGIIFEGGTWHHVFATFDRDSVTGLKVYIDGLQVGTSQDISNIGDLYNAVAFIIGARTGGTENFKGRIDDVQVYNRTFSAEEIQRLYELGN